MRSTTETTKLTTQIKQAKEALQASQQRLATLEAQARKREQAARRERQLRWGKILDDLGLLALDDGTLQEVLRDAVQRLTPGTPSHTTGGGHPRQSPPLDNGVGTTLTTMRGIVSPAPSDGSEDAGA